MDQVTTNPRGVYADLSTIDTEKQEITVTDDASINSNKRASSTGNGNDKSSTYMLILIVVVVLCVCVLTWAIVFTVLWYRADHNSKSNPVVVSIGDELFANVYYDVTDAQGSHEVTVCDIQKPDNCSEIYALYPLYDASSNKYVGSVSFYDIKQIDHVGNSLAREIATFQFTDTSYIPYLAYKVNFLSKSALAFYPSGYVFNTVSYTNDISYGNVNVTLTVSGNRRLLNFVYKKQKESSISTSNNTTYIYYDKTDFQGLNRTNYCVNGYKNCTIEAYNARLFDISDNHIGYAFFYDILQLSKHGLLYVQERAVYQFIDKSYTDFVYDYAYISSSGDSVFPPGFKLDVKPFTSTHNDVNIVEVLEVYDTKRYITLKGCIFQSCSGFSTPFPPSSLQHSVNATFQYDSNYLFTRDCGATSYTGSTNCSYLISSLSLMYQNSSQAGDCNARGFYQYRDGNSYASIYFDIFLFNNEKRFSFSAFANTTGHVNAISFFNSYVVEQKSFASSDPFHPGYMRLIAFTNNKRDVLLAF